MDPYERALRDYFRLACELWLARVERALWEFARALDAWLNDLIEHPTPRWRESLEAFLAQQKAAGRIPKPESRDSILNYLYAWSKTVDWGAIEKRSVASADRTRHERPVASVSPASVRARRLRALKQAARSYDRRHPPAPPNWLFHIKLVEAQRYFEEMRQVLEGLGQRLDAAKLDEELDVESEVDSIEDLIWLQNDAIESAQEAWLRDNLSRDAMSRLNDLPRPSRLGLPMFVDADQAARLNHQGMQISARLGERDKTLAWIEYGATKAEQAGMAAGIALGGAVVLNAVRTGGKWAVVKTVAVGAAAIAAEQGVEHRLRAAGANETVVRGFRLAAVLVSLIIWRRRSGLANSPTSRATVPIHATPAAPKPSRPRAPVSSVPRVGARAGKRRSTYLPGRYSGSASDPGAYWRSGRRVFPTRRNSGLAGKQLRDEQRQFFIEGLRAGKLPGELRGQARVAGYDRRGGINDVGGPDRLADRGAEKMLQEALQIVREGQ